MAEYVQQSIEEMLPELEQMERVGLFTASETRSILRKRKAYEYKLRRRSKEKDDFLRYIEYEIHVLALLRKRREKTGYVFKKDEIDIAVIMRIHKLFKLASVRFQDDVNIRMSHIDFSKKSKEKSHVSRLFNQMLQIHSKKPALWVLAAKWELEEQLSMEMSRGTLQRGLRFNPKSELLWREYFRMELLHADKLRKRREVLGLADGEKMDEEGATDAVLEGKVASLVFTRAVEAVTGDAAFCLSFLPIAQLFDFAQTIEEEIFEFMKLHHPHNELTWEALARRYVSHLDQLAANKGKKLKGSKLDKLKELEGEADAVFREAVRSVPTEKMWSVYIRFCEERLEKKAPDDLREKRFQHTLSALQLGNKAGLLSAEMMKLWLELLRRSGDVEGVESVSQLGVEKYPRSVSLWLERLKAVEDLSPADRVQERFQKTLQKAIDAIAEHESLPLWEHGLDWCLVRCPHYTETLLQDGVTRGACVSLPLKEFYVTWAQAVHGMAHARDVYSRLAAIAPFSVKYFQNYIHLEAGQSKPKLKKIRAAYEDAVREFGESSPELWLDYIRSEQQWAIDAPETVGNLYSRAIKTLGGTLTELFVSRFTLLQTGHAQ